MFPPRYFPVRYFPVRYFPPGSTTFTDVIDYVYKRDTDIYISKATSLNANASNTVQISVKDFSFNRTAITKDVDKNTIDGTQPRGIKSYVQTINPVEFSFTTYIKPIIDTVVTSPEEYLWISLMGSDTISSNSTTSTIDFSNGNVQSLQNLTLWFNQPGKTRASYRLDNAVIDRATINFDINNIAEITWEGRALSIIRTGTPPTSTDRSSDIGCLKNKLSTIDLSVRTESFSLALIGGSITIDNNNVFYGRPQLGKTTTAEGHYTGNRTIKGTINIYSKTGPLYSLNLFEDLLNRMQLTNYETDYTAAITINIAGTNAPYVSLDIPVAVLNSGRQDFNEILSTKILTKF
jgi:hypothetical protein